MSKNKEEIKLKNSVLGRGLGAIFGENIDIKKTSNSINEINIEQIQTNSMQPRKFFDNKKLEELSLSIKENGIIQPITIRKINENEYQLISGERRLRACKMVGLKTIPAYIRIANDKQLLEMALVENIQRANLNPIEISLSYQRLIEECGCTQEKIANKVGKKRSTITNFLRILKLPLDIQIALKEDKISMGHAKALVNIENESLQLKLLQKIILNNLSVRKVEELVKNIGAKKDNNKNIPLELKEYTFNLKKELKEKLNTSINIKINEVRKEGNELKKGEIIIKFDSKEKFDEIINLIS